MNPDLFLGQRGAVIAGLLAGQSNSVAAAEHKVPVAVVRRWRGEYRDQQQASIAKILKLAVALGDDPATWSPPALSAIYHVLTSLQENRV